MKKKDELMANNPVNEKLNMKRLNIFWNVVDRLSNKSNFIEGFYHKTVGREYRNEIDSFELTKSKKILHIGCGTYPITALILSELNGVKIVTIDHDAKSVETAQKIITNIMHFKGKRNDIKEMAAMKVLEMLKHLLEEIK